MVSFRFDAEQETPFSEIYDHRHNPDLVRDVPGITAAYRRNSSVGRRPAWHHAIYEAADLAGLEASLEAMRAPFRLAENMARQQRDSGLHLTITWEDAATFKPIFRTP